MTEYKTAKEHRKGTTTQNKKWDTVLETLEHSTMSSAIALKKSASYAAISTFLFSCCCWL